MPGSSRRCAAADADRLGKLAGKWYHDPRREARRLLLDYLDLPLNAYRHEALIKRLFKLAEKAGDDEVMGCFLVAFDRSIRRRKRTRYHYDSRARQSSETETLVMPRGTTMPRDESAKKAARNPRTGETIRVPWFRWPRDPARIKELLATKRLFTVHTRNYLRRRIWRYFRNLGKLHPDRYSVAVTALLKRYTDDDVPDGLALLDNWGLMHILFHHCPALEALPHGWAVAAGHALSELVPAPIYEELWTKRPDRLLELLKEARARPVRQWVLRLIQRDHGKLFAGLPLVELLALLSHDDTEVVALVAEALRQAPGLDRLSVDRWLELLDAKQPLAIEVICELMAAHLRPTQLTLDQAVKLASSRVLPVARLGLKFLQAHAPRTEAECRALLGLAEAESVPVRPELVRWARGVLDKSPHFTYAWVLEFLDSRHADVRAEGWAWFRESPRTRDEVEMWKRLLESPYDDVRLKLLTVLEQVVAGRRETWLEAGRLDAELIRLLWATVLLNVHRGNRAKPAVVRQLVTRMAKRADEAMALLPILRVALRSVRGPEWRAGLAGSCSSSSAARPRNTGTRCFQLQYERITNHTNNARIREPLLVHSCNSCDSWLFEIGCPGGFRDRDAAVLRRGGDCLRLRPQGRCSYGPAGSPRLD